MMSRCFSGPRVCVGKIAHSVRSGRIRSFSKVQSCTRSAHGVAIRDCRFLEELLHERKGRRSAGRALFLATGAGRFYPQRCFVTFCAFLLARFSSIRGRRARERRALWTHNHPFLRRAEVHTFRFFAYVSRAAFLSMEAAQVSADVKEFVEQRSLSTVYREITAMKFASSFPPYCPGPYRVLKCERTLRSPRVDRPHFAPFFAQLYILGCTVFAFLYRSHFKYLAAYPRVIARCRRKL